MGYNRYMQILFFIALLLLLSGGALIPFFYESPSLYYKFGTEKLLLQAGKVSGIIAVVLLILQPLFVSRISFVDNLFGFKKALHYHKRNALVILIAAALHPVLVLASNRFVFFSFEWRYWPEFLGMFLLFTLAVMLATAYFRKTTGLSYRKWLLLHRFLAPPVFIMVFLHVFNVSKTFESDLPFWALCLGAAAVLFFLMTTYIGRIATKTSTLED